ncbi:hypothetical protein L6452_22886 [Arctium lappa]|uniref:Uncharacterized protein n=1 Tax=Arctium lappa TaxID=4217 RepID=A0ACB9B064_ARCLA|nr:hypothetical protein L6452_22886 [Arctium lappa]
MLEVRRGEKHLCAWGNDAANEVVELTIQYIKVDSDSPMAFVTTGFIPSPILLCYTGIFGTIQIFTLCLNLRNLLQVVALEPKRLRVAITVAAALLLFQVIKDEGEGEIMAFDDDQFETDAILFGMVGIW